jgi:3-oxoacyl-[acyl-carrier-protein] synthase III
MRYHGVVVERLGSVVGELVSARQAIHNGRFSARDAARTGQESIAVCAGATGPQLAVRSARQALASETGPVALHLHATIHDPGLDFWSASSYVADQLGVDVRMTMSLNAMSNSAVAGMELAASVLTAQHGSGRALITAGDVFAMPRFDAWQSDSGIAYGDGAAAVLLSRGSRGVADLVSTASYADPGLEGLHRGDEQWCSGRTRRPPVRLRQRKKQWLSSRAGVDEVDLRNAVGVTTVTKHALDDAEIDLSDVGYVLCPHYGAALLERHCLTPLGISADRTLAWLGRRYGHLGASDQIVALHHIQQHGLAKPGDYVLLLGIGVGMTWTAAVLRSRGDGAGTVVP